VIHLDSIFVCCIFCSTVCLCYLAIIGYNEINIHTYIRYVRLLHFLSKLKSKLKLNSRVGNQLAKRLVKTTQLPVTSCVSSVLLYTTELLERNRDKKAEGQTNRMQSLTPSYREDHKKCTVSWLHNTCRNGNRVRYSSFAVTVNRHIDLVLGAWLKWRHSVSSTSCVTDITRLPFGTRSCGSVADHCPVNILCPTDGPRYCHACLLDVTSGYCRRTFRIYT